MAMIPLLGFIGQTGRTLLGEWNSLQEDEVSVRSSAVVGYVNINPNPNYASKPDNWFHREGDDSLLWAGWKNGEHHWFRFGQDGVDTRFFSEPIGRDVIQAIDYPVYEKDGGVCWGRVPHEAPVFGIDEAGAAVAYPLKVLDKVEVVNTQLGDQHAVVALNPDQGYVSIFDASLHGHRVTLGHSGYFKSKLPVLYDRGTRSLWSEDDGAMVAIAGERKGTRLKRIAKLDLIAWGDWREKHPDGRLLIGADRSRALPVD